MMPKGMKIELVDGIIYWKNTTGNITERDAHQISDHIKALIESGSVQAVLVDNRELFGVWTPEVDKVWIDLMTYLPSHVDRTATLCQNPINKLQLNYLSSQAGTEDAVQAFTDGERSEMKAFLNLNDHPLPHLDT